MIILTYIGIFTVVNTLLVLMTWIYVKFLNKKEFDNSVFKLKYHFLNYVIGYFSICILMLSDLLYLFKIRNPKE